jgi:hypothetical protein
VLGSKEIVSEYSSDSSVVPDYNSDSSYDFYFRLDSIEPEADYNCAEKLLSGPAVGLVITVLQPVNSSTGLSHPEIPKFQDVNRKKI